MSALLRWGLSAFACSLFLLMTGCAVSAAPAPFKTAAPHLRQMLVSTAKTQRTRKAQHAAKRHRKGSAAAAELPLRQLPPNVTLKALLAPGTPAPGGEILWRVLKLTQSGGDKQLVWSGSEAEPKIHLEPGRYTVEAVYGFASGSQDIRVEEGKRAQISVPLNAGTVRAKATAVPGGSALGDMFFILRKASGTGKTKWTIPVAHTTLTDERAADVPREANEVGRTTLTEAVFHVPAGSYRLVARHGMAMIDMPVNVEAGHITDAEAVMNTGMLTLSASTGPGGHTFSGVQFAIYDASSNDGRLIARSNRDEPVFNLPAGKYRVTADLGLTHSESRFELAAGENRAEAVILNAGALRLSSVLTGHRQPASHQLIYRIYALAPNGGPSGQPVTTLDTAASTLFLQSGKYQIESQYGPHNVRQERDIDVAAGDITEVKFEHHASSVKLKLVKRAGGASLTKVKWTLKYSDGGTVLISQDAVPQLILQAGSYQIVAQHDSKTYSRTFDAAANQEETIELIAE